MEAPKEDIKLDEGKKVDIPRINIDLDSNKSDESTILRRPKGFKVKKQPEQTQQTPDNTQQ